MEGSSRRNAGEEETPRKGTGATIQLTPDELQKMIEEASRKAIVEYERRTATPLVKETARRQLFDNVELLRESRVQGEQEHRSKRPASSDADSSSHSRTKRREPVISRAEVESVGKQIENLNRQIDELKKQGEIVAHNKNSPFCNDILVQVVELGFRVPDLPRYDGTKDPYEHVAAFDMVMNLYGQPGPIMAKLFATTLTGKAQEWFTNLPRGNIDSHEQLIQRFSFHFASRRKQKRSATHLFTIRQREDETLKSFVGRFNNEMIEIQDLRIDMMVSILIHGLKKGPFASALACDPPGDAEQLMALAQKYIDEEEMNAMKDYERRERDHMYKKSNEAREVGGSRQKQEKQRESKYIPKYHNYTPLPMSREKALMMVENAEVPKWPRHTREETRRSRSRSRDRNPGPSKSTLAPAAGNNAPTKGVIYTIAGGSSSNNSNRDRKRYARTMYSSRGREFVLKVEEEEAISFNSSDKPEETGEMNDPIVIRLDIANFTVHKVLVDSGSSADIIFKSVIDKMGLKNLRLEPIRTPLVGFGGSEVTSLGMIELPVPIGDEPKRRTTMVKFLVVDTPFAYNVILGRPGLNSFRAVISTYHMKVKFPTDRGVGEVACDQKEARKCYNLSLKGEPEAKKRKVKEDAEPRPYEAEHLKPSEEYKVVQLTPDEPDKTTRIGASMKEKEMAMIRFLRENMDVFAWGPSDFTGIDPKVIVHRLNVDPAMRPVQQKKRSFGSDKNEIIRKEVDKLLQAGYVAKIQYTDWLSNVVLVPKSSGKWRMCVDFTDLNKACPKDPYPLPRIDVMVDSTAGYEMFSMMDAYQGYHQIHMAEEDRDKTSFITEKGIFCYNMMPFGLKNAGATYQRLINKMFGDLLEKTMEVYVDDMLVKSKRSQDHLADLAQAFAIMTSYGMKLNPDKFISRSADKSLPFFKILRRPKNFEWNEECKKALQELKEYLTTPPLLANPKEGEELLLYLGVSENAVSLVLVREEGGQQNPIYYVSKMLQGAELRYTEMEKLALALVVTARKLRPYFQSHRVIVLTNYPLKHIMSRPEASGRLIKWTVELGQYDIDGGAGIWIQGPRGIEIKVAVRLAFPVTNNEAEYETLILGLELAFQAGAKDLEVPRAENDKADALSKFGAAMDGIGDRKITALVRGRPSIAGGPEVQTVAEPKSWKDEIAKYLKDGTLPADPIAAKRVKFRATRFTMLSGQLYKRTVDGPLLKCLDEERALYVMREIHEGSCGNHSGARSLAQKIIRQGFYWPTVAKDSKELVKKCESCQKYASLIHQPATPVEPIKIACPFDQWGIDIVGSFPPAPAQKKFIIVAVEYFTKWVEAEAVAKISEKEVINFIWKNIICRGPMAYRTTPRTATGETPFCLVYGTEAIIPAEIGEESQRVAMYDPEANQQERSFDLTLIEEKRDAAYARILHHKGLMMRSQGRRVRPRQLQVGDLVLKKVEVSRHVGKLEPPWERPFKVVEIKKKGTYRLQDMQGRNLPRPWNIQNLKRFYA
ncbi:UNVERIFIED_CONTAM: Retrovirus-related Pol polyprotein from transposon [Sesamum indicum]